MINKTLKQNSGGKRGGSLPATRLPAGQGWRGPVAAFIVTILAIFGIIRYFYQFEKRALFEADQTYLTEQAQKILSGKLSLIGAPTSVGGMFIGPFYNYFTAIFLKIFNLNPYTVEFLSSLWGILTPIIIFLVAQKIFDQKTALFSSLFAVFSIKFLDRANIPPLLFPLPIISLLIFYFFTRIQNNPRSLIIISFLTGLSLHSHFSGFFFLVFTFFYVFIKKPRIKKINLFFSLAAFLFFLLPLFLFDLRHQFLISHNLIGFFTGKNLPLTITLFQRISRPFLIDFVYLKQVLIGFPDLFQNLSFIFLIFFSLNLFTNKKLSLPILIWLFGPLFLFIFYKGLIIPYYFILQFPVLFLLLGHSVKRVLFQKNNPLWLVLKTITLLILTLFIFENVKVWQSFSSSKSLYYKIKALKLIKKESRGEQIYLSHTIYPGLEFGYSYLEEYLKINKQNDQNLPNYTLIQPYNWHNIEPQYIFGDIGVNFPKKN